jgi:hypothetical protein
MFYFEHHPHPVKKATFSNIFYHVLLILFPLILSTISLNGSAFYNEQECLDSKFHITIAHQRGPMGLIRKSLLIGKNKCELHITEQQLRFFKNTWIVDVCRMPVHIKTQQGTTQIFKKEEPCHKSSSVNHPFCIETKKLKNLVLDDGLIFAQGDKESLQHDHGKVYCSYLLLSKYLDESIVLSREQNFHPFSMTPAPYAQEIKTPTPTTTSTPTGKPPSSLKNSLKKSDAATF